jgi:hypothetical protein
VDEFKKRSVGYSSCDEYGRRAKGKIDKEGEERGNGRERSWEERVE